MYHNVFNNNTIKNQLHEEIKKLNKNIKDHVSCMIQQQDIYSMNSGYDKICQFSQMFVRPCVRSDKRISA